jgi:hypothetical protein
MVLLRDDRRALLHPENGRLRLLPEKRSRLGVTLAGRAFDWNANKQDYAINGRVNLDS